LSKIKHLALNQEPDPVFLATFGLVAFGQKDYVLGRRFYEASVLRAKELRATELEFRARAHWLFAEIGAQRLSREEAQRYTEALDKQVQRGGLSTYVIENWKMLRARTLLIRHAQEENTGVQLPIMLAD
jgi:hypothetical protein